MNELNKKLSGNEEAFPNYKELLDLSQKIENESFKFFAKEFEEVLHFQGLTKIEIKERWTIWNKKQNNMKID